MAENKKKSRVAKDVSVSEQKKAGIFGKNSNVNLENSNLENDDFSQIPCEVLFGGIDEREFGKPAGDKSASSDDFPAIVMDASYFASAVLDGEGEKSAEAQNCIQKIISQNGQLFVPQLFWNEIGNVLLGASKPRKDGNPARITKKQLSDIFMLMSDLPFSTDMQPDAETRLRILLLAQSENLTYYDATYLEMARRHNLVLKTWDDALLAASESD